MANIKVSEMIEATSFDDGDYTMIVQANQNKKISKENMLSDIPTIQNNISTINNNIGDLTNLETSDTSSLVNAINELKNAEVYSTNEIKTNKVWVDGKPIYRKVINYTGTLSAGGNYIAHNISNLGTVVDAKGYTLFGTSYYMMSAYETANNFINIKSISSDNVVVQIGSSWGSSFSSSGCTLILEYTKTAD